MHKAIPRFSIKSMLVPLLATEFLLPNDLSLVVTPPYDFLVIEEETPADNYKHVLTSPSLNGKILFEAESKNRR